MTNHDHQRHLLILFLLFAPLIVGCQGCREDEATTTPAAALTARDLQALPADSKQTRMLVKPGHWMSMTQSWQSNNEDLRGSLTFSPSVAGSGSAPIESIRPAVLPKGQSKQLDCRVLIPLGNSGEKKAYDIRTVFAAGSQSLPKEGGDSLAEAMSPHEFFFVALTERPEQLTMLQIADWVRPAQDTFSDRRILDYRIVFPSGVSRVPLPDTMFEWSSTAYLFWDDIAPEKLTLDQRRAVRDWIYWGGQLIINGPACAETFVASDLTDLFPLDSARSVGIESDPLIELVNNWSVASDSSAGTITALLKDSSERLGITGPLKSDSKSIPLTSDLIVERPVGNGRVVLTRFDLTSGWMLKWHSLQSFYNGVLLRRPSRAYESVNEEAILRYSDNMRGRENDSRLNTRFRLISRDLNLSLPSADTEQQSSVQDADEAASVAKVKSEEADQPTALGDSPWFAPNDFYRPGYGVGTWTDTSDVALVATRLLRDEAGITIPSVKFVAKSLAIYLLILVPLNYLVFWFLGRLEWAWIMVPIVGLAGAAWIARSAQLDIGFARSKTEIDFLELHAGYQRGHVSRYMAVYNSLSTTYDLSFDSQDAVAAPLGIFATGGTRSNCVFRQAYEPNVSLAGFAIPSNQTGTIHAEQMIDTGGAFEVANPNQMWDSDWDVENQSNLMLYDTVVIGRSMEGELRYSSVGIFEPSSVAKVKWKPGSGKVARDLPLSVNRMMEPLLKGDTLRPGEAIMVGRIEETIGGVEMTPAVSQSKGQTVVVVHLSPSLLPSAAKDANLRQDIKTLDSELDAEDDLGEFKD